ncbi:hypothetical protein RJT34_23198 [Clitoria ternatea]|uniref:Transmembrane protein n=1 Tax=Clitoria ternatea TaxID=43366 RepID=A0AAN9FSC7_CLITE
MIAYCEQMGWQRKAKELFNPREVFYLLTITILSLLLPLSLLLLATISGAQFHLQTFTLFPSPQPFSSLFFFTFHINPCILYFLVSLVSVATLIQGLMGKITLLNSSSSSTSTCSLLQPGVYIAWILLCTFQVCVGLGIEGSILAGVYDNRPGFGPERSLLSKVVFLLGLHETTQVWCRRVVRPVVDDTVFGGNKREERWIERVGLAASLGTLWWWRLREEVESLVVVAEAKKEDMEIGDFVGWWLYYLIVTIGMVRIVKGLMWMFMISLCRRRVMQVSHVEMESSQNDDKV